MLQKKYINTYVLYVCIYIQQIVNSMYIKLKTQNLGHGRNT